MEYFSGVFPRFGVTHDPHRDTFPENQQLRISQGDSATLRLDGEGFCCIKRSPQERSRAGVHTGGKAKHPFNK